MSRGYAVHRPDPSAAHHSLQRGVSCITLIRESGKKPEKSAEPDRDCCSALSSTAQALISYLCLCHDGLSQPPADLLWAFKLHYDLGEVVLLNAVQPNLSGSAHFLVSSRIPS